MIRFFKRKMNVWIPVALALILGCGLAVILIPPMVQDQELTREAREEEIFYQSLKLPATSNAEPDSPAEGNDPEISENTETLSETALTEEADEATWNPFADTAPYVARLPRISGLPAGSEEDPDGILHSGARFGRFNRSTDIINPVENPEAYNNWLNGPSRPSAKTGRTGADLDACLRQNEDFVAWIKIPGTNVDYPIVQTNNTDYYLNHTFSGKASTLGTLFSLGKSDWQTPGKNIAIYGHDIEGSGKKMFNALLQYKKESFFRNHQEIYLDSIYMTGVYRIFAVFDITLGDFDPSAASFAGSGGFTDFIRQAKSLSLYDTGVDVPGDSTVVSLITCDRYFKRKIGRFVVMAVKIE